MFAKKKKYFYIISFSDRKSLYIYMKSRNQMLNSWYNTKDKGYHKAQRNKNTSSTHNGSKNETFLVLHLRHVYNY